MHERLVFWRLLRFKSVGCLMEAMIFCYSAECLVSPSFKLKISRPMCLFAEGESNGQ